MSAPENKPPWMIRTRSLHFVALVAAFIVFSAIVASGITCGVDDAASRFFKSIQGNAAVDTIMMVITTMGDVSTLFLAGIVLTVIRRIRKAGMIFLIALIVIVVLVMYMKPVIGRANPPYTFEPALEVPDNFSLESDSLAPFAASFSYPSGHVSRTTAFAFIIGFLVYQKSRKASYAIWGLPLMVGITRLYVMQHYPTDLIGGFLFGSMVSVVLANSMKLEEPFSMSRIKGKEDNKPSSSPRGGNL